MRRIIGSLDGTAVESVSLTGPGGLRAEVLTYGARLAALWVPGRDGRMADIVLGHERLEDWAACTAYIGATCGRYANRIAGGRFVLDGQEVQLDRNEGANTLHGGAQGFDRKHWRIAAQSAHVVTLAAVSAAGEMGFPGQMQMRVTYRLEVNRLWIEMQATTDAPTVANIVNHAYFNLAGGGDILGHHLRIPAAHVLPVDDARIPTGEVRAVAGTPFDFRQARTIGSLMPDAMGFDHCYCLSGPAGRVAGSPLLPAAEVWDPATGRRLRLWTTEPGLQLYTGAHLGAHPGGPLPGKAGGNRPFGGLALETQRFPDSPNRPQFPSSRLDPGQTYRHRMLFDVTPCD